MFRSFVTLRRRIGLLLLGAFVLGIPEYAIADDHDGDAETSWVSMSTAGVDVGAGCTDERTPHLASGDTSHDDDAKHGMSPRKGHAAHVCHDGHAHGQTLPPEEDAIGGRTPNDGVPSTSSALPPSRLNEPSLRPPIA